MKKLLSILMLLVAIVTGAWAENATIKIGVSSLTTYAATFSSSSTSSNITASATAFTVGSSLNTSSSTYDKATAPYSVKYKPKSNISITEYSDAFSISAKFTVASGYNFTPTSISATIVTEAANYKYQAVLTDGTTTYTSNEVSSSENGEFTFTFSSLSGTALSGDVTFKIQMKSTAGNKKFFVVNLPITIVGNIESATPATAYTVTFNAGDHGTYTGGDIKEASAGAGITLPALTTLADGYIFNGWFTDATGGKKAGNASETYNPSADTPLYAQYTEIPTPTFVLSATSIEVGQTAQIKVTGKNDLDGVTLSDISYGTADIVTVDATTGVVTPVAAGSTTITFNSSAVTDKYKASTGNELSITVTAPKCATPTISPVSFSTDNQEVTITSETADATIYYTTDGTDPTTSNDVYDPTHKPTISSTTTFKAYAVKTGYDDSEVATQKITRTSSAVVASWDFTNWSSTTQAGVRADGTNWRDYETSKTDKPLNDKVYSNKRANATFVYSETTIPETKGLSFATTDYTFGLAFDQASTSLGTYHGSQYLWLYGSNSIITIPSLTAGQTIEIGFESHKTSEERTLTISNINESNPKATEYKVQTVTVKNDGNVTIYPSKGMHIYYITVTSNVETEGITTDNGVATYVTKNALDFTGLETKAYVVKSVDTKKNKVFTEEVTTVPAGTALLVKGATVNVPVIANATAPATNLFQVSNGSVTGAAGNIFAYSKSSKQFKKVASSVTIPSGKCYLEINGVLGSLDVDFEGEATAINNVDANENANSAAPVKVIKNGKLYIGNYNLAGQQVK